MAWRLSAGSSTSLRITLVQEASEVVGGRTYPQKQKAFTAHTSEEDMADGERKPITPLTRAVP